MKLKFLGICCIMGLSSVLTACAPDISARSYTTQQVGQAAATTRGLIIAATPVKVSNGGGMNVGTVAGAVSGGVAGSAIGGGTRANILGGVGGALVGGMLGNYAEQKLSTQTGMQYSVKLRNGRIYTITQGIEPILSVGQRVFVIFSNPTRIVASY